MRRSWLCCALVLLIVAVAIEGGLLIAVYASASRMDAPEPSDVMVVLGAGISMDGQPRSTLRLRLERTLALFEQGFAPRIIVTGAQGDDEPMPEAYAMRNWLLERGVPEEAILCEPNSFNTQQNLENAKALMAEHGLQTAIIVTSDYHLRRALSMAEALGMDASGAGSRNAITRRYRLSNSIRETLSWVKYTFTRPFI